MRQNRDQLTQSPTGTSPVIRKNIISVEMYMSNIRIYYHIIFNYIYDINIKRK